MQDLINPNKYGTSTVENFGTWEYFSPVLPASSLFSILYLLTCLHLGFNSLFSQKCTAFTALKIIFILINRSIFVYELEASVMSGSYAG